MSENAWTLNGAQFGTRDYLQRDWQSVLIIILGIISKNTQAGKRKVFSSKL